MKQVMINQGQVKVEDIPAPKAVKGYVLVKVFNSCISVGTELSGIKSSEMPLWKRALKDPDKVKKTIEMVVKQGLSRTHNFVKSKVSSDAPIGYSVAGKVLDVGEGIDDIFIGDHVACAGAQCAHHAEIVCIPRNLVVPMPDGLGFPEASTVTLGAIALQGVRRAQPTLGESFVVIGLGILGQLTVQMLKANGCRVIGIDLDRDRIKVTKQLGLDVGIHPADGDDIEHVARLTDGVGADGIIITASTPSDEVMSTAFKMCRKKGRVIIVGDIGLNLNRWDFYRNEIDILISTSYGPGRYDQTYEENGMDYPVSYVRWTENRNMSAYLNLMVEGKLKVMPLVAATYPIDEAVKAYDSVKDAVSSAPMVLLSYPEAAESTATTLQNPAAKAAGNGKLRIAIAGAGAFSTFMHLPNLKNLSNRYFLQAIMNRTGHKASTITKQFGAKYATTDYKEILADPDTDVVLISTRHNMHTSMTLDALKAGKHVLVEKPLSLTKNELKQIEEFYKAGTAEKPLPVLMTGYNRRFSIFAKRIMKEISGRSNPMIINYRMNAGYIPLDAWVHTAEGGGRNIGEACHIYDLFVYLTGSTAVKVSAHAIMPKTGYYSHKDNFSATITFEDGSVANLIYTALGSGDHSKEQMNIYLDGKVIVLDDYQKLTITGSSSGIDNRTIDKGHKEELEHFADAVQKGGDWPMPLWQQLETMEIAFRVEDCLIGKD